MNYNNIESMIGTAASMVVVLFLKGENYMENFNQAQEFFGIRLAECRRNKGYTQEELSGRLGVTPQALSKWEKDETWHFLQSSMDTVKLILGEEVVAAFVDNRFVDKILKVREELAWKGILLPRVRIRDEKCIKSKEFYILSYENVLYKEELTEINEETADYIVKQLEKTVQAKYKEILNTDIIKNLTDNLKIQHPALIEGIVPEKISYGLLLDICRKVVERGNSMKNLIKIIETVERALREKPESSTNELAEQVCFTIENENNFWTMIKSS